MSVSVICDIWRAKGWRKKETRGNVLIISSSEKDMRVHETSTRGKNQECCPSIFVRRSTFYTQRASRSCWCTLLAVQRFPKAMAVLISASRGGTIFLSLSVWGMLLSVCAQPTPRASRSCWCISWQFSGGMQALSTSAWFMLAISGMKVIIGLDLYLRFYMKF